MKLQVIGLEAFQRKVAKSYSKLTDTKKRNAQMVIALDSWIQRNFQQEGRMGGQAWIELKPATILARRQGKNMGAGTKILQDRGNLKGDWKHLYTKYRSAIQSRQPHSQVHEHGAPKKNIPKRKILPTRKVAWGFLSKIARKFIDEALR